MVDKQLLNLVAFCALMENNDGITGKSPDYILEKFNRYVGKNTEEYQWGLDADNRLKLKKWAETWLKMEI